LQRGSIGLPATSDASLNDRPDALPERIQQIQLFRKGQSGALPSPGFLAGENVRAIRVWETWTLHAVNPAGC
jgi:hypothetical protein